MGRKTSSQTQIIQKRRTSRYVFIVLSGYLSIFLDNLPDTKKSKDGRERREGVQLTDRESRTLHRRNAIEMLKNTFFEHPIKIA